MTSARQDDSRVPAFLARTLRRPRLDGKPMPALVRGSSLIPIADRAESGAWRIAIVIGLALLAWIPILASVVWWVR